jgi:hypothetical protein
MRTRSFRPPRHWLAGAPGRPSNLLTELDFREVTPVFKATAGSGAIAQIAAFCGLAPTHYYDLAQAAGAFSDSATTQDLSVFVGSTGFARARSLVGLSPDVGDAGLPRLRAD